MAQNAEDYIPVLKQWGVIITDDIDDLAVTTAKIAAANITLAKLASWVTPSHVVKYAWTATYWWWWTSSTVTVSWIASTDIVSAVIRASTTSVSLNKCVPTTNTLTFTYSADPWASTTIDYVVLRVAA